MKHLFASVAVVAIVAGTSSVALADCEIVDADFEKTLMEQPEKRAGYAGTTVRDLRALRDAAMTLAAYGKEDACEEVATAIREISEDPDKAYEDRRASNGGGDKMAPLAEREKADYKNAVPVAQMSGQLRADKLLGADVRGVNNETIGEVTDIILDPTGKPGYAVISYGGFLGLGEEVSAVPFDRMKVSKQGSVFYLAMTEEQLEQAPRFERGKFDWIQDENWRKKNDSYYGSMKSGANAD
ncbi:PRC-barrel domain-containing protein [Oceanibacterium hippocampi]|uniref:PRC-barrel domain protein n=1 Tax=Oceanibacterium hippocampi TaxID=745714 RepID=A0A1Y5U1A0_9PROT|nr:PRC-barrel domain-containing protein [Oceanibacterium hippocampi]SLN73815.1 PRC-barrel domain protein [Oceanibacterium hippocampi]